VHFVLIIFGRHFADHLFFGNAKRRSRWIWDFIQRRKAELGENPTLKTIKELLAVWSAACKAMPRELLEASFDETGLLHGEPAIPLNQQEHVKSVLAASRATYGVFLPDLQLYDTRDRVNIMDAWAEAARVEDPDRLEPYDYLLESPLKAFQHTAEAMKHWWPHQRLEVMPEYLAPQSAINHYLAAKNDLEAAARVGIHTNVAIALANAKEAKLAVLDRYQETSPVVMPAEYLRSMSADEAKLLATLGVAPKAPRAKLTSKGRLDAAQCFLDLAGSPGFFFFLL
jgi:hypothetical protein